MGLIWVLNRSLLLGSLQFFFILSSAEDCCGTNSVAPSVQSSSWVRRLGGELLFERPSGLGFIQTTEVDHTATISGIKVSSPQTIITVDLNGTGDYLTVQQAVDAVPAYNTQRVEIRILAGTYR